LKHYLSKQRKYFYFFIQNNPLLSIPPLLIKKFIPTLLIKKIIPTLLIKKLSFPYYWSCCIFLFSFHLADYELACTNAIIILSYTYIAIAFNLSIRSLLIIFNSFFAADPCTDVLGPDGPFLLCIM
jgi:hypothetical protein